MKTRALAIMTCMLLITVTGCNQTDTSQSAPTTAASPSIQTALVAEIASYDDVFANINDAVFTTRETAAMEDTGNDFRLNRIDVVDENGFDHQGIVVVCDGSDDFTKAYQEYVEQLVRIYGDDMGVIAGYRNAATKGDRTYRESDINFFCIQDVEFIDRNGIEQTGVVIAIDGSDQYVEQGALLYSIFRNAYS